MIDATVGGMSGDGGEGGGSGDGEECKGSIAVTLVLAATHFTHRHTN